MFSMTTEYALRAAVYLSESGSVMRTSQQVAEATRVPVRYMAKVLQLLAEDGLAISQRGPSGGFTLAREPSAITLLDIVQAVEPIKRIRSCPLNLPEHEHQLCPLHRAMDDLAAQAERSLGATTLADVMTEPLVPLGIRINAPRAGTAASEADRDRAPTENPDGTTNGRGADRGGGGTFGLPPRE